MSTGTASQYFSTCMSGSGLCVFDVLIAKRLAPSIIATKSHMISMKMDSNLIEAAKASYSYLTLAVMFKGHDKPVMVFSNGLIDIVKRIEAVTGITVEGYDVTVAKHE